MKRFFAFASIITAVMVVTACAWMQETNLTARLLTEQSVLRVIDEDAERAARVLEITSDLKATIVDGEAFSVPWLYDRVVGEINWNNLSTADAQLIRTLLLTARQELETRFGDGLLEEDERFKITTFLGWIEGAAALVT